MPYTLKTNQISVKDPETGEYSGVDILAEQTEQGLIAELQAEGTTQVNRIIQAAVDVQTANVPASATSSGKAGQIAYDSNYIYVCVADNTWKRAALEAW